MAGRLISGPADQRAVKCRGQRERGKHLLGLHHDLRTDAVTGQQQDFQRFALSCLASRLGSAGESRNRPVEPIGQTRPYGKQVAVAPLEQRPVQKMPGDGEAVEHVG